MLNGTGVRTLGAHALFGGHQTLNRAFVAALPQLEPVHFTA